MARPVLSAILVHAVACADTCVVAAAVALLDAEEDSAGRFANTTANSKIKRNFARMLFVALSPLSFMSASVFYMISNEFHRTESSLLVARAFKKLPKKKKKKALIHFRYLSKHAFSIFHSTTRQDHMMSHANVLQLSSKYHLEANSMAFCDTFAMTEASQLNE